MKSEKIYNAWKNQKRQIKVGGKLAEKVMNQVCLYEQKKKKPLLDMQRFIEVISAHPLAKAGLITIAAITGIVRVAFVVHILLFRY